MVRVIQSGLLLLFCLFNLTLVSAQLKLAEDINYPCCNSLIQQGNWSGSTTVKISSPGLVYPGYANSGVGNAFTLLDANGSNVRNNVNFPISDSVYMSFLVNVTATYAGPAGTPLVGFRGGVASANLQTSGFVISNTGGLKFGVSANGVVTYESTSRSLNTTYLVVLQYNSITRTESLFVNPIVNVAEPAADVVSVVLGSSSATSISEIDFYNSANADAIIDGIRVGLTWADVATSGAIVGGSMLLNEPFNYPNLDALTAHGWGNYSGTEQITVASPGLTLPGVGAIANKASIGSGGTHGSFVKPFPPVNSGVIYASFLLNSTNSIPNDSYAMLNFMQPGATTSENERMGFVLDNNALSVKTSTGTTAINGPTVPSNTTVFVAVSYDLSTGVFSVYNNPPMGATFPPPPSVTGSLSLPDIDIGGLTLITPSSSATLSIDELRVSQSWADVVAVPTPAYQPTSLLFNSVTQNSVNATFAPATFAPDGYVVFRGNNLPPVSGPANNTSYSVGQIVGDATVAYVGTGTSFSEFSLLPGSTYSYIVYSYNTNGGGLYSYNTDLTAQRQVTTEVCCDPSNLTLSSVTNSSVTVNFNTVAGPTGYLLVRGIAGFGAAPVDGTEYSPGDLLGTATVVGYIPGSPYVDSGLLPSTLYNYSVYSYGGTSSYSYRETTPIQNSATTLANQPTTQATSIGFSSLFSNSMTLTWTNGNGASRLVAVSTSPIVATPTDGQSYSPNPNFGAGPTLAPGVFVVFAGSGNTAPVLSLTASTLYYYRVFEYNGTFNDANYLTTSVIGNPASQTSIAAAPITPASNILFSSVTNSSMVLNWTNGTGTKRIVLAKAGSAVNANPVNGSGYTASATFGSGTQIGTGNFVVYDGTGTTVTVSGLSALTTYHFEVYEYDGTAGTQSYLTTTAAGNPANRSTLANAPTTQATNILFSSLTNNSMTLSWANGNGGNRIVLAHATTAVSATPVNGTTYTSNITFGSGTQLGTGNYVVYDGPGNTVTVNGLSPLTVYFFEVFEYNGAANTQNYMTSVAAGNPASQTTMATPVVTQASVITFSSLTGISMTLNWTSGTGATRIVLARSGSAVNSNPVNGTAYTANTVFASGTQVGTGNYVVYDGTGNTVTVTGLTALTNYFFEVYEYNGSTGTQNYLTTTAAGNPSSQTTMAAAVVTQASNISIFAPTPNSLTLSWTNGTGANRVVLAKAGSAVSSNPVNSTTYTANVSFGSGTQIGAGNFVIFNGVGNTVTVTGLSPSTTYHFEVYEYNGSAGTQNYLTTTAAGNPNNRSTLALLPTIQANTIVFSSIATNALTLTWTNGNGSNRIVLAHAGSAVDSNPVSTTGYTASSVFGSGSQIGTGNFVVYDGTGSTVTVTGLSTVTTYFFEVYEYNGSVGIQNYLTTTATGNPSSRITLSTAPLTQASNISFSGVTTTSVTLNWTNGSGSSRLVLAHSLAPVDSNPVSGSTYSSNSIFASGSQVGTGNYVVYDGTGTSVTVTGLLPTSTFYFQVFEYNGSGGSQNFLTTTSTGNPNNQTTVTGPPTVVATNIVFSGITNNQMTVGWTNGNGSNRLVVVRPGSAVNSTPVNTVIYTANSAIGSAPQLGTGNFIVYNGTGNSVTVTGLSTTTVYFFQVFEYTGASNPSYLTTTGTGNPASQTTTSAPPTLQANNLAFSVVSNNTLTLSWANGNGTSRLVVGKAGSAVNAGPINSTAYTANAAFGLGSATAAGNFVIYDGTGTSVNITGLSGATTYHFQVYEYTGSGLTSNYLTTTAVGNPGNKVTLAGPATTQANTITFSSVSNNQMTVGWTSGNGTSRIVLARAGTAVNATPLSATSYSANAAFGSGAQIGTGNYVVYDGTGNSVNITGLSVSTTYFFQVFEYTGSALTANYLISTATLNPNSQTTLAPPVTAQASSLVFSTVQNNQVSLSWTSGNGANRLVMARAGAPVDASPVNGSTYTVASTIGTANKVVYIGNAGNTVVTGLLSNTTYHFQVFEFNGTGNDNNYNTNTGIGNPAQQLTTTDPPSVAAGSLIQETSFTANWNSVTGATGGYFIDVSANGFSTNLPGFSNLAVAGISVSVTGLSGGTSYQYRVRAANAAGPSPNSTTVTVLTLPVPPVASAGTSVTTTTFVANWSSVPSATDYFLDVATDNLFTSMLPSFTNLQITGVTSASVSGLTPGTNYYFRVRAKNATGPSASSNTFNQMTKPLVPPNVRSSSITSSGFIIQWDPVVGASSYELYVMDQSLNPIAGYNPKTVFTAFSQVTGLLASTLYVVQVRAVNAGGPSDFSGQQPVLTADAAGGGGGSIVAPQINLATSANANSVKATITANTGINNLITYYHRKITETNFTVGAPVPGNSLEVTYTPAVDLDDMGMEYYFKAKDGFNRQDSTSHAFVYTPSANADVKSLAGLASGGTIESYRIFAIPLKMTSNSISEIFSPVEIQYGGYDKAKWRLVHFQSGRNVDYKSGLEKIELGKGYWYNSVDDISISVSGTAAEGNQANGGILISLEQGYTQIGNPYSFDINWNDVLVKNGSPSGVGKLYIYDASHASFKETDVLPAWQGGFVKSDNSNSIKVPVTVKRTAGRVGSVAATPSSLEGQAWLLPIKVTQGNAYNEMGGIGMHPEASLDNDRFDEQTLPRFIKYLELSSFHENYFLHHFAKDVVPTTDRYNWNFDLASNFDSGPITLSWDPKSLGTNDAQLFLYDQGAEMIVDMKQNSSYTIDPTANHSLTFMFSADSRSILPEITGLGRPYPNPFSQSVTIPFITSATGSSIDISVYDLTGRRVRTLTRGSFDPGLHEVVWDGTDDQGTRLASGLYIYRFTGEQIQIRQGRVVLK